MKFVTMLFLIALSYKLMQSVYCMTDTGLGTTVLNVHLLPLYFLNVKKEIKDLGKGLSYK